MFEGLLQCAEVGGFLVQRRTAQRRKSQKAAPASNPSKRLDAQTESEDVHGSRSGNGTEEAEANMPVGGEADAVALSRFDLKATPPSSVAAYLLQCLVLPCCIILACLTGCAPSLALILYAGGSPGAFSASSDIADAGHGRSQENDPLNELQQEEVCLPMAPYDLTTTEAVAEPTLVGTLLPSHRRAPKRLP